MTEPAKEPTEPSAAKPSAPAHHAHAHESKASAPAAPALVKIRFMKNCGHYTEGQEIEVSPEMADQFCSLRERSNGSELVKWQNACRVSDLEKLKNIDPVAGGLSVDEMRAMGMKNVAADPNGPGPIEPERLRGSKKSEPKPSDEAGFSDEKSPDEGKSGKQSAELNAANPKNKSRAHS